MLRLYAGALLFIAKPREHQYSFIIRKFSMRRYSLMLRNDHEFIQKVKLYFQQQTQYDYELEKGCLWNCAYSVSIGGKCGIIIPLQNQMLSAYMKNNFEYPELNLLAIQSYGESLLFDIVRVLPDHPTGPFPFTGYLEPVLGAENRIGNIKDYLKCFDTNPGADHRYEVTLCVSQPRPGTSEAWDFSAKEYSEHGNPVFVGHVFLTMKETTGLKKIIRNVGFYPEGNVWPYHPSDQGCLNNDSYTSFNIGLNIEVNSHQFTQILNYLAKGNDKGYRYNLNSNNCTNFALDALSAAGIFIPRNVGNWNGGSGLNPGRLGQDLRTMKLSSHMNLITVYEAHGNQGDCQ
jgi:hypothetical protein